jgi:hypothetical protein
MAALLRLVDLAEADWADLQIQIPKVEQAVQKREQLWELEQRLHRKVQKSEPEQPQEQ